MSINKVLKALDIMTLENNQKKITDVYKDSSDDSLFTFIYKESFFQIGKYHSNDSYNNDTTEFIFKIRSNRDCSEGVDYTTEQKDYWTIEARQSFENLYTVIKSKYYGLDEIFNKIFEDDLIRENEIPF